MGQCRSLSPDETLALLRDLLWVYDPEFDEKKMTKYSGLECGIVVDTMTEPYAIASGTCLWAAREEIKQCEPNMVFAHNFADIKRDKPTEEGIHQPKQVSQPPTKKLPSSRNRIWPDSTHPTDSLGTLRIRISHAENLPNSRRMGTQSPYCVWRLLNADQYELATGRTPQHRNGGQTPQWGMHEFYVDVANQNIDDCALFFTIKTPGMLPGTSLTIADGRNGLRDLSKTSDWQAAISPLNTKGHPAGKLQFLIKWSTR